MTQNQNRNVISLLLTDDQQQSCACIKSRNLASVVDLVQL